MRDMDNNLLVKGIASWTILDKETHKLSRTQVTFDGDFYSNSNYPENYRRKKMNLVPSGDVKEWDYNVLLSDLDHNGHMNNAKYFDVAYNMQASSSLPKCGMIQFVNEAKLGDTIHIKYFKNEDGKECYVGTLGDSTCFNIEYDV